VTSLPEQDLTTRIITILNSNLNSAIQEQDLVAVHRIGRPTPDGNAASSPKPAPIIVQFSIRQLRNSTLSKRRLLKGKGFSLTEQLTARKSQILKKCNELVSAQKIQSTWSHDGRILIKTLSNRIAVVASQADLEKFC
jgi:hypothetical protein